MKRYKLEGWQTELKSEINQTYFKLLAKFIKEEREKYQIFPPENEIFTAFKLTPFNQVKVVILGQDPYHDHNQAHGLSFSVKKGIPLPPSLCNIFIELKNDLGIPISNDGDLSGWATQGVLMLNAVLTVRSHQANSHKDKGWERFTDAVIRIISENRPHVVFVLWGLYAQKKASLINDRKHTMIKSAHPSPFSAHKGFFGSKPFSQINLALKESGQTEIDWNLAHEKIKI
jgi:uracil-DNA glycosylase